MPWEWGEGTSEKEQKKKQKRPKKIQFKQFVSIVKQFNSMIKAGLQIVDALSILEETPGRVGEVAKEWKLAILDGKPLSEAISGTVAGIPQEFSIIIASGEESGTLVQVLDVYIKELERQNTIERKKRSSLMYPSIVLGVVGIILVVIFGVALPKIEMAFLESNVAPEGISALIFGISHLITKIGIKTSLVIAMIFAAWIMSPYGRKMIVFIFGIIPAVRRLNYTSRWSIFCSIIGTSLASGLTLPQALSMAKHVPPKELGKNYDQLIEGVYHGKDILEIDTVKWPSMAKGFVKSGMQSGDLAESFLSLGGYFADESEELASTLSAALEPAILVFLIGTIGLVPIAIVKTMSQMYMAVMGVQ